LLPVTDDEPVFPFTTSAAFLADVVRALDEYDMSVLDVELIKTHPGTIAADFEAFVEASAALGARHIVTQIPEPDRSRAAEQFRDICELADSMNLTVDLEFIPWSTTADLEAAVDIVTRADMPNGAILVDTLHFDRSDSSLTRLEELPAHLFNFVQLCDARMASSNESEELIRVARGDREAPGWGAIALEPILEALPPLPYALEVPSDTKRRQLGDVEYARFVLEKARLLLGRDMHKQTIGSR
jgi:sugar phosphate isomerase/epimerase